MSSSAGPASTTTGLDSRHEELGESAKVSRTVPGATVPLEVEGYPAAPPELQLEQVHVYVRHGTSPVLSLSTWNLTAMRTLRYSCIGERTPVRIRMSDPPGNIPERWNLCKTAHRFRAAVTSNMNATNATEEVTVRRVVEGANGDVGAGEW